MTDVTGTDGKDHQGRFAHGNRFGKGRARQRPLRDVCSFEEEAKLWALHVELAQTDAGAREFILRQLNGNPMPTAPEVPAIVWEPITCTADLFGAINAVLGAHQAELIDASGLKFLTGIIMDLAKCLEAVELGPKVRRLEEAYAAQQAAQGANG